MMIRRILGRCALAVSRRMFNRGMRMAHRSVGIEIWAERKCGVIRKVSE